MTELDQGSIRCSGQVTSERRSVYEVRACGFWEFRGLSMKIVNISKAGKRSFSATHFKKCISFTEASYGVWSRRIDPHFKTPDGERAAIRDRQ